MTASMTDLKHRAGKRLIDFAVTRLLRKDVAALFREQLSLGAAAMLDRQRVTVQLREDLRDQPEPPRGWRGSRDAHVDYWNDVYAHPYHLDQRDPKEGA